MSMERVEKNAAKRAAGQELTADDLTSGASVTYGRAKSHDPVANLTIDLYDAAISAADAVRSGEYDPEKYVVTIACSPQTAVLAAVTGATLASKRNGGSNEEATNAGVRAGMIIAEALSLGRNDLGMKWAGFAMVPDSRIPYLSVAVAVHRKEDPVQVVSDEEYNTLIHMRGEAEKADELVAQIEKMDGAATVFGGNQPSAIN